MPGGESCEPFRVYNNTQANGIYGSSPQSASWWASWNNWCLGDKISIRVVGLGNLSSGNHTFKIEVLDTVFADNQGDFSIQHTYRTRLNKLTLILTQVGIYLV